jgi:hypothetical protein
MIKKIIQHYFPKKRPTPFRHRIIETRDKKSLRVRRAVEYEDNAFDGGKEKELVGYKLNKLSQMY